MKKINTFFIVLTLGLFTVACSNNQTETKKEKEVTETKIESYIETIKQTQTIAETVKETQEIKETSTSEDETLKEDTADKTTKDNLNKPEVETNKNIVEVKEEGRVDKENADTVETIDTRKISDDKFNNEMTVKMLEKLKDYSVTLISGENTVNFPKDNLQAIASYEDEESFGWVIRYGVNKIGLGRYYKASTTFALVLFDAKNIFEQNDDLIKNDSAKEYKDIAKKLIQQEIRTDANVEYAY